MRASKKFLYVVVVLFFANIFSAVDTFKNILLIINYNHAHYESIPLLKKIYAPYFKMIVFYGPKGHAEVNLYNHTMGYTSYMCIAEAMKKYPHHDGYLFLMDDCILNTWLLDNLDSSKLWFGQLAWVNNHDKGLPVNLEKGQNQLPNWEWWHHTRWGYPKIKKAYQEIPIHYKKRLSENVGTFHVVIGFSDFAYIPAHYKKQFIELATIFGKHEVFLEIALPTILNCLSPGKEWEWLSAKNTYAHGCQDFNKEAILNHPIKLSSQTNRTFIESVFKNS